MAAGPIGVAGRRDSLPAQETAADPLQNYCPDLDQWPGSWAYKARDIPPGRRMVECFTPFLRELLAMSASRPTLRRHRDNIWALGGEVISRLQIDSGLRRRPIEQVVLELIGDDGGPLLSHGQSETEQRSFDATCRKLFRFLTALDSRRGRNCSATIWMRIASPEMLPEADPLPHVTCSRAVRLGELRWDGSVWQHEMSWSVRW
jgi:hypothetical protein